MLASVIAPAQAQFTIRVDTASKLGPFKPIWSYFGYDEPNYTYAANGQKLISELAAMSQVPVYIRTHNLLTTGDGTPALKWGSTNAYTEDSNGKSVYSWDIIDRIFDTYIQFKARPFVEIGFTPEALSPKPHPYQHSWPETKIAAGWAYPPKNDQKWSELIYQWVRHSIHRYGAGEVNSWYWEVWNEPDIEYWQGTPEEYNRMYDLSTDAVKRAAPGSRVGGPATTGPASPSAAAFLKQFLDHCAHSKNFATGKIGAPLDFITFHAKGKVSMIDGHARMGIARQLEDIAQGFEIVTSYPQFRGLPIILSESDPEGCAACSASKYAQNAYRRKALYACYTAVTMSNIFRLADQYKANLYGMLTWAFEFENQPYFAGVRTLATNGIDLPVLNVFRMAAMMSGDRVAVESDAGLELKEIETLGVNKHPDINALASRSNHDVSVMVWNYHDDDVAAPGAEVHLEVSGIPRSIQRVQLHHYRIDRDHSNAYTVWKELGSPANPTAEQYSQMESAGKLQLFADPESLPADAGTVQLNFVLPRQGVSLLQVRWQK